MKQMSQILSEVNYDMSKVKLVKCLGVHNEEDWVEFNLRNNYDEFDIIRVVEGAVEGRPKSTHDGHSTDRTLELVRNFPDPDGKIQLITMDRPFKSLEEQKQLFLEFASDGEWLFIVDCVTGDRHVPVKIDNKIQIMSLKELFELYVLDSTIKTIGNKEVIFTDNLKTLSVVEIKYPEHRLEVENRGKAKLSEYFRSKLTKKQIFILDLYESGELKFNQDNNPAIRTLRKKLSSIKQVVSEWRIVTKICRSISSRDIILNRNKFGETKTTSDHMIASSVDKSKLQYSKATNINSELIQISTINGEKGADSLRLSDWLDLDRLNFVEEDGALYFNSKRSDQRKFYVQDCMSGEILRDFAWLLGYYAAEGSIDEEKMANFRICGNKKDVNRAKDILEAISYHTSNYGYSEKYNGTKVWHLGVTSAVVIRLFAELFDLGSHNKKVPSLMFSMSRDIKASFIDGYNTGDGSKIKLTEKDKYITTTISQKLLGGICLLNKQLGRDLSLTYREPEGFSDNYDRDCVAYNCYQDVVKRRSNNFNEQKNLGPTNDFVYDMVVPGTNNFCDAAGLVVIHNCDEFYMEGDIARVRKAIEQHPMASEFIPLFLHFYRDFYHIKAPHPEWQIQHQRIFRYREGMRYHTHPVVTDNNGKCTYFTPEYQLLRYTLPIYIYHYGHAKGPEFHRMKQEFYKKELENFGVAVAAFDEKFEEFVNYSEDLSTVLHFDGPHPEALHDHDSFNFKDAFYSDKDLVNWKDNIIYQRDRLPTIALWMMPEFEQRMQALYNGVAV